MKREDANLLPNVANTRISEAIVIGRFKLAKK